MLESMWDNVLKEGCSFCVIDPANDRTVGVSLNFNASIDFEEINVGPWQLCSIFWLLSKRM